MGRYSEINQVVLFDGECKLCNNAIQFILNRDSKARFRFATLQSVNLKEIEQSFSQVNLPDSILLIDQGNLYIKSKAALKIARHLDGLWPMFYVFILVPTPICDWFYDVIARNRAKWFGKLDSCMVPTKEFESRFINLEETT